MSENNIVSTTGEVTDLELSNENLNMPMPTKEERHETKNRLLALEEKDPSKGQSIVSQYWEASQGDSIKGIFKGFKVLQKKDPSEPEGVKPIPAVLIETLEGLRLCGSMQIVDSFINTVEQGAAVYIECIEARANQMKKFEIKILD